MSAAHVVDLQREADTLVTKMVESFRGLITSSTVSNEDSNTDATVPLHTTNLLHAADELLTLIDTLRRNLALSDVKAIDAEINAALDSAQAPF